jgi:malate dehydrogenase (quinone)
MSSKHFEVIVVGAGISGAALAYELARYTDISSIGILEKYEDVGTLNSAGTSNSQTIHIGDIETNYTLKKAAITKKTAKMVEKYCLQYGYENKIIFSHQKMALGVGDEEVEFMLERYEEFYKLFPYLEVWDKEHLKEIEPKLVYDENGNEREDTIVGIGAKGQWTTVDYGKMTKSLIENAKTQKDTDVELYLNSEVTDIEKNSDGKFVLYTKDNQEYTADFVVVNAGAHSLYLAHRMGYGHDFGCLPVAGSFYLTTKHILNGKVYMVQNPKLPFAALHGDPDILADGFTRFGPTALVLPKLERYKPGTYLDFWKTLRFDGKIASIFVDLLSDSDIRNYILKNFMFEVPYINKKLFLNDAKKIVPSLSESDIEYAEGFGGVRPQVLNKKEKKLMLGEASIDTKEGIVFNMTPSPGATSCLGNGLRDVKKIVEYLDREFYEEIFSDELVCKESDDIVVSHDEQEKYVSKIREEIHTHEKEYHPEIHHDGELADYWTKLFHWSV